MTSDAKWLMDAISTLEAQQATHRESVHMAWQQLENAGLINKVRVHEFRCRRCGPRATVIRLGNHTLARTKDHKQSPGMNAARSVESARVKNTLDGNRHWPGHTYDIDDLADFDGFEVTCRHQLTNVIARDLLVLVRDVRPGHPGPPTLL